MALARCDRASVSPDAAFRLASHRQSASLLWKAKDQLAQKTGSKSTVYAVDGSQYCGEWRNNRKEGKGVQVYRNGNKFDGFFANDKRHGQGSFFVKRGTRLRLQYSGEWSEDKKHGLGTYHFESGNRYEGSWEHGVIQGWGIMYYENEDRYEGDWVDNKRNGTGTLYLANGDRFQGNFSDDKKEGPGTYYYVSKNQRLDGEWVNDVPKTGMVSELNVDEGSRLPAIGLADPVGVLQTEIAHIEAARASGEYDDGSDTDVLEEDEEDFAENDAVYEREQRLAAERVKFLDEQDAAAGIALPEGSDDEA